MNTRGTQHGRSVLFLASGRQYLASHSLRGVRCVSRKYYRYVGVTQFNRLDPDVPIALGQRHCFWGLLDTDSESLAICCDLLWSRGGEDPRVKRSRRIFAELVDQQFTPCSEFEAARLS
jgi:hypothetical protein